jgi:hypothetical protein
MRTQSALRNSKLNQYWRVRAGASENAASDRAITNALLSGKNLTDNIAVTSNSRMKGKRFCFLFRFYPR